VSSVKIEEASWILTLDENRRIIRDGTILIEDGKISRIAKAERLRTVKADTVINGRGRLVAPGMVNCHMHISYAHSMRGLVPDATPRLNYLQRVFEFQRAMKPEEEYYTSLLATAELLKNGCTSFLEPGCVNSLASVVRAVEKTGIRAVVGKTFADLENRLGVERVETKEALRRTEEIIRTYGGRGGKVTPWIMPFSPDCCSDESLHSASELSERYDAGITTHCAGSHDAADEFRKAHGKGEIDHIGDIGMLGERTLLAHPIFVSNSEIERIASTKTGVVFCPSSSSRGSGLGLAGKLPEMLGKGITVALGSDSASSSYHLDIIRSMYLLSLIYKDARLDRTILPPEQVLEMGTVSGAKALGCERDFGSLSAGKSADIVIFNTMTPQWRAVFNPVSNMVNSADGRNVETVIIGGKTVVDGGRVISVDEAELCTKVQEIAEGIADRLGIVCESRWPIE
jgi:5-methylthioadenosine/S-adenosylhomocysteine deaminase